MKLSHRTPFINLASNPFVSLINALKPELQRALLKRAQPGVGVEGHFGKLNLCGPYEPQVAFYSVVIKSISSSSLMFM